MRRSTGSAANYPLSLHGVGLSLGSTDSLDSAHLAKLKRLADRIEPARVSEHLCWSSVNGRHYNDLLPLPYTPEALDHVCARVEQRAGLSWPRDPGGKRLELFRVPESTLAEADFVAEVAARTGCGLLVDVNNIYVNARNHGIDADAYLARDSAPQPSRRSTSPGSTPAVLCLIDTHGTPVAPEVWSLYERARCALWAGAHADRMGH
mgnify:CR=1 FL=1